MFYFRFLPTSPQRDGLLLLLIRLLQLLSPLQQHRKGIFRLVHGTSVG
jgi:hypothetical protein